MEEKQFQRHQIVWSPTRVGDTIEVDGESLMITYLESVKLDSDGRIAISGKGIAVVK